MSKKYVNKLRYLHYSTIFSTEGDIKLSMESRACFADALNRRLQNVEYTLELIRDPNYALNSHMSNLCLLGERELKKHIGLARRLFPFKYSVKPTVYEGYDAFEVKLSLDAKHFYHRYLLTWVRYAYEFPFNIILNDTIRMKHEYLRKESYTNLFVLCADCFYQGPAYNSGHSISYSRWNYSKFLKESELRDIINTIAQENSCWSRVNNIYPSENEVFSKILPSTGNENYLDYWLDVEAFEERAKTYLSGYKLLKK